MAKISVITPSVRPDALETVGKALRKQTFNEYEWIIVSPNAQSEFWNSEWSQKNIEGADRWEHGEAVQGKTYTGWKDQADTSVLLLQEPPKQEGDYWAVYKAYNEAIRNASGELIISWQDFTHAKPDTLERFWQHYQDEPRTVVGAVGNKYSDDSWTVMTWKDPRERDDMGSYYDCIFNDIELNLAAFPKAAFYEVGGFDERFDKYSSLCGLDVLSRLSMLGTWKFKLDQGIKSYSLEHGRLPNWEENLPFQKAWPEALLEYSKNPVLDYLHD